LVSQVAHYGRQRLHKQSLRNSALLSSAQCVRPRRCHYKEHHPRNQQDNHLAHAKIAARLNAGWAAKNASEDDDDRYEYQ
jgi:hypothetical protein